jgi:hypothetical protein
VDTLKELLMDMQGGVAETSLADLVDDDDEVEGLEMVED